MKFPKGTLALTSLKPPFQYLFYASERIPGAAGGGRVGEEIIGEGMIHKTPVTKGAGR